MTFSMIAAKNGVVETYYDNGQLESRTNYKNGVVVE